MERADRFYFPRDRVAYIVGRATLRRRLANYLGADPRSLTFSYGSAGKPMLAETHASSLAFNLSHSGGYALLGVSSDYPLGVDTEVEDHTIEIRQLTKRFFSTDERSAILALPPSNQVTAFYRTWTRKEAFLKALGAGLNLPLDQFTVTTDLNGPVKMTAIDWSPGEAADWSLASFTVGDRLPGAVALRGELVGLEFYE